MRLMLESVEDFTALLPDGLDVSLFSAMVVGVCRLRQKEQSKITAAKRLKTPCLSLRSGQLKSNANYAVSSLATSCSSCCLDAPINCMFLRGVREGIRY